MHQAFSEIEVSLFGPGYGECLVLHLGDNTEIYIVDSCIHPHNRRQPVALAYLHHMHIDPATGRPTGHCYALARRSYPRAGTHSTGVCISRVCLFRSSPAR